MNNIDIDTEKLSAEIEKIKSTKKNFEEIFQQVKNDTESLKDYWSTRTSESVFSSFQEFYSVFENVTAELQKDIDFLERTVSNSYVAKDKGISKLVDDKIALKN
jgi:WXG100 family type VII secretion target